MDNLPVRRDDGTDPYDLFVDILGWCVFHPKATAIIAIMAVIILLLL